MNTDYMLKMAGKYYAVWLKAVLKYSKEAWDYTYRLLKMMKVVEYAGMVLKAATEVMETIERFFPPTRKVAKAAGLVLKWLEGISREVMIYLNELLDIMVEMADNGKELIVS